MGLVFKHEEVSGKRRYCVQNRAIATGLESEPHRSHCVLVPSAPTINTVFLHPSVIPRILICQQLLKSPSGLSIKLEAILYLTPHRQHLAGISAADNVFLWVKQQQQIKVVLSNQWMIYRPALASALAVICRSACGKRNLRVLKQIIKTQIQPTYSVPYLPEGRWLNKAIQNLFAAVGFAAIFQTKRERLEPKLYD